MMWWDRKRIMKEWNQEKQAELLERDAFGSGRNRLEEPVSEECREARNKGLYYLQFSNKTEDEMRRKLAEQGFSPASVENAVNFLKSYRYLNDEDYVRRYLERYGRKKSKRQIRFELHQKGISSEVLERMLEEQPVDETAQIVSFLEKKNYAGEEAGREEKQKISAFLARKGFSYDAIQTAMCRYVQKETD